MKGNAEFRQFVNEGRMIASEALDHNDYPDMELLRRLATYHVNLRIAKAMEKYGTEIKPSEQDIEKGIVALASMAFQQIYAYKATKKLEAWPIGKSND